MAEIFNIDHETGDLSQYTSTATDAGDLSVTAAALCGSYGLQAFIDDANSIYGQKDFNQLTSSKYRFRFYIDPNGLVMADYDEFEVCEIYYNGNYRARVILSYLSGNYRIRARVYSDGGVAHSTGYYVISDSEHYIECLIEYASSSTASDGVFTLWIDGVQQEQITGLDLYDLAKPNQARLGAIGGLDAGTSGTLYLDAFILRDDNVEIGPCGAAGRAKKRLLRVGVRQGVHLGM